MRFKFKKLSVVLSALMASFLIFSSIELFGNCSEHFGNGIMTANAAERVTDTLTAADLTATSTTYTDFSGVCKNTAVFAGNTSKDSGAISIRSKYSNSGIVTTTSGGKALKVTIVFNSNCTTGRVVDIYGKTTAYESAADLYGANQGTKVGSITCGTSTELIISGDYSFIGIRSYDGQIKIDSISITYKSKYSVTNLLTNATNDMEDLTTIYEGDFYKAKLIPDDGYKINDDDITLTINDNDVTDLYVSNNVIDIPKNVVDGNIVITAVGTALEYSQFKNEIREGYYILSDNDKSLALTGSGVNSDAHPTGDPLGLQDDGLIVAPKKDYIWHIFKPKGYNDWAIYNLEKNQYLKITNTETKLQLDNFSDKFCLFDIQYSISSGDYQIKRINRTDSNKLGYHSDNNFFGYYSASKNITLFSECVPIEEITFSDQTIYIPYCDNVKTKQIVANIYPENATNKQLRWTSSDETKISVDENTGIATAKAESAQVTITAAATDGSGVVGTCTATIQKLTNTVTVIPNTLDLPIGKSQKLFTKSFPLGAEVSWSSANENVAVVDSDGAVRVVGQGTTTITATATDGSGAFGTCTVSSATSSYKYVLVNSISELNDNDEIVLGYRTRVSDSDEFILNSIAGDYYEKTTTNKFLNNVTGSISNGEEILVLYPGAQTFTVGLAGNKWNDKRLYQNPNNSNEFFVTNVPLTAGDEFVLRLDGSNWYKYSNVQDGCLSLVSQGNDGNIIINETNTYDIYVNKNPGDGQKNIFLAKSNEAAATGSNAQNYSLFGKFNGSSVFVNKLLFQKSSNEYCIKDVYLSANDEFAVRMGNENWWYHYYNVEEGCRNLVDPIGSDNNIKIKESGKYDIYCKTDGDDNKRVWIAKSTSTPVPNFSVHGTFNGTNIWTDKLMIQEYAGSSKYYIDNVYLKAGDVFDVQGDYDSWFNYDSVKSGCRNLVDHNESNNIKILQDGYYKIEFDTNGDSSDYNRHIWISLASDPTQPETTSEYILRESTVNSYNWTLTNSNGEILSARATKTDLYLLPYSSTGGYSYLWNITNNDLGNGYFNIFTHYGSSNVNEDIYIKYNKASNVSKYGAYKAEQNQQIVSLYKKVAVTDNAERFVSAVDICSNQEFKRETYKENEYFALYASSLYDGLTNEEKQLEDVIDAKSTLDSITEKINQYKHLESVVSALHMDSTVEGQCLVLYEDAKAAYNNLTVEEKEIFNGDEYVEECARLAAWARAHGEIFNSYDYSAADSFVKQSFKYNLSETEYQSILIVVISASIMLLSTSATLLFLLNKKKKAKNQK